MKGYRSRHLGPMQMTTDTAVRATRMVVHDQGRSPTCKPHRMLLMLLAVALEDIPYIDHPELKIDKHETIEMPFRYVKNRDGTPLMPDGMVDLIKQDSNNGFGDLL